MCGEHRGTAGLRAEIRAHPTEQHRGRAVGPGRHAAVQGRHRRRVEILRSDDFYRPAHQIIYDIITDLYGRGDPADAVTILDELQKRGEVARIGGGAYLHTLTAVVPTAANAGYYARIVREQAILRRLIEAGTRIVSYGYGGQDEEVDDLVDRAQAEIYKVTERRTSEDYIPLADIMPGALDELEAIGGRSGQMVGVPTGFQDLDSLTNGLHPGQMIVVAARPAIGKSTLGLDFARSAAIKHGMTTVVFSLEMSRNEITMRLLSAEARVALHAMRSGTNDRRRLGQAGPEDGRGGRGPAVHRRLAQHVDDGDQGQVPSSQAAQRPAVRHHRLPAADVLAEEDREPPERGLRDLPGHQAPRQGAGGPGDRDLPAQPWPRAADGQAAHGQRPP
ncbi:hypothetical protein GCM10018952_14450 [Streptosporangium vulgare]